jgi:hypothetical protein
VEVPADLLGDAGTLNDQVMAVIRQQLHVPGGAVEFRNRQIRVTQRGHSDGLGVDGIRPTWLAATTTRTGHQTGRHPKNALTRSE